MAVSFGTGGNWSTRSKPPICRESLTTKEVEKNRVQGTSYILLIRDTIFVVLHLYLPLRFIYTNVYFNPNLSQGLIMIDILLDILNNQL